MWGATAGVDRAAGATSNVDISRPAAPTYSVGRGRASRDLRRPTSLEEHVDEAVELLRRYLEAGAGGPPDDLVRRLLAEALERAAECDGLTPEWAPRADDPVLLRRPPCSAACSMRRR